MKRTLFLILLVAAGCAKKDEPPKDEEKKPEAPWKVSRNTNGDPVITLDAAAQKTMGLQVTPLAATSLVPEVKGFGHVVDPAPLAELFIELSKAQVSFDHSHQELERMKVLRKDNNASVRALQTAEAAYLQNQADLTAIRINIERTFGGRVAEFAGPLVVPPARKREPNPLLDAIAYARTAFLVRVDLPVSESLKLAPTGARIVGLGESDPPVPAEFFGEVPAIDPQSQFRGYFFLVSTNQPRLTPGMAVTAFMQTDGQALSGIVVPRDSVVRFNGATWVYVQTSDQQFVRRGISTDRPGDGGWFVTRGAAAGDKVVTVGAQIILSEEMSAAGFSDGEHH